MSQVFPNQQGTLSVVVTGPLSGFVELETVTPVPTSQVRRATS
jgi:hypothetical protein